MTEGSVAKTITFATLAAIKYTSELMYVQEEQKYKATLQMEAFCW
jgi:hypothetical protein